MLLIQVFCDTVSYLSLGTAFVLFTAVASARALIPGMQ